MDNNSPDILAELTEIETENGQPWEPECLGKFSAQLRVGSRRFAAHIMLGSNLFSGMTVDIPIKFDDFLEASPFLGEGSEFYIADRGCHCRGKVVKIFPHPPTPMLARRVETGQETSLDPSDGTKKAQSPSVSNNADALPKATENWTPPSELAGPLPRSCGPSPRYRFWRICIMASGILCFVLFALLAGFPLAKLYAQKTLQENGVHVDGTIVDSLFIPGKATTRGSTPAHFYIDYSYKAMEDTPDGKREAVYFGHGNLKQSTHPSAQISPGKIIPVSYDPSAPNRSTLADDQDLGEYSYIRFAAYAITAVCIGVTAYFTRLLSISYRIERRLLMWGHAANAKLLSQKPAAVNRKYLIVTYAFRDNRGIYIRYSRYIKVENESYQPDAELTMIFDPDNSHSFSPYPIPLVTLESL